MEETILRQSQAGYFQSAVKVLLGDVVLTNKRVFYSGTQERVKLNHGAVGNIIRDKMESAMGYDNLQEDLIFDIPLSEVSASLKRFGLSKRLLLTDANGKQFSLQINNKADRNEWVEAVEKAKKGQ